MSLCISLCSNSCFNRCTSCTKRSIRASKRLLCCTKVSPTSVGLTVARSMTCFALSAKRKVDSDSSIHLSAGDTVAINKVRELPPRESCSKRVNTESL